MHDEQELRQLLASVARMEERLLALTDRVGRLEDVERDNPLRDAVAKLERRQRELLDQIARWRGFIAIIMILSGIGGWIITQWQHVVAFFQRGP